jgi:hypothetical protein
LAKLVAADDFSGAGKKQGQGAERKVLDADFIAIAA